MVLQVNPKGLAFDHNTDVQLGLDDYINRNAKTLPPGYPWKEELTKINGIKAKYVSCGNNHTVLIDMNNDVWAFGFNYHGELGLGNNGYDKNINIPTKINDIHIN